ncbi:MAG: hypothetical protein V1913_09360 [Fibrobacterota bacterium]
MYYKDSTHLIVNDLVQLFVDNVALEQVQDVTKRWYQPQFQGEEVVIKKDRPWENVTYFTYSNYAVLRDPADGLFKCWYEDLNVIPGVYPAPLAHHSRQLYAYSEDGINFIKPELDICLVDGRKTNIVLGDEKYGWVHSASVIMDPYPPSLEYRFRTLFSHQWKDAASPRNRIETAHSPDGIHWMVDTHYPRFGMSGPNLNDVTCLFYDEDAREFVQNTRHYLQWAGAINLRSPYTHSFNGPHALDNWALESRRRVWQTHSHDFIHWSEPILAANTDDDEDNLDESFYGMSQWKIGTTHLAFAGVLHYVDNTRDVQLLVSRDGLRWKRTNKRQPFLAARGEGYWDGYMQSICSPPIEVGDELWFYAGGSACTHDLWMCRNEGFVHPEHEDPEKIQLSLGLAKLRKEGFASIDANAYREGIVTTRALVSLGTKLIINGRCRPGGTIRVEVADRYDEVIKPCLKDNCDPFGGDSVNHVVTWKGSPEIPAGNEERLVWRKLRFFLKNAELFSFRFAGSNGCPLGETDKQGGGV